jgi:hypothetical protein
VYAGVCSQFVAENAALQKAQLMARLWEGPMKRKSLEELKGIRLHADPVGLCEIYPSLAEFMTVATFESDGKVERREAPTVTTWCSGGQWKCSVKDRAEGLVLWLSAESWVQLLQMIEMFVLEPSAPWRHDEGEFNGKRVKK